MTDKSEMIAKGLGKTDFTEMTMLVAEELTQTRNIAKYILKREVKLKANYARFGKVFSKREILYLSLESCSQLILQLC